MSNQPEQSAQLTRPAQQQYEYYDNEYVPEGFGFQNNGVICWCNSLLQMMLGLPSLNKTLLEQEEILQGNPFAAKYISLLKAILPNKPGVKHNEIDLSGMSAEILGALMRKIKGTHKELNFGARQECVDEAFALFIESFGCEKIERLFLNHYQFNIYCTNCKELISSTRDKSFRIQMFTPVILDNAKKFTDHMRVHPSELEGIYKCTKCGHVMTKFYRQERLRGLKEIIVLIFNKFQRKENRWFPEEIIFNENSTTLPPIKYKLVGKIEHAGTCAGGHYWAHSLRGDSWRKFNDTSVSPGDPSPTPATFMIAYHIVLPSAEQN